MVDKFVALLLVALPGFGQAVEYRIRRLNLPMTAVVIDMNAHGEVLYTNTGQDGRNYLSGRRYAYVLTRTGKNLKMPMPVDSELFYRTQPKGISDDGTICGVVTDFTYRILAGSFIWNYRTGFIPVPTGGTIADINDQGEVAVNFPGYIQAVYNYKTGSSYFMEKGDSALMSVANNGWSCGFSYAYDNGRRVVLQENAGGFALDATSNGYFFKNTTQNEVKVWNSDGTVKTRIQTGWSMSLSFNANLEAVGFRATSPTFGWPAYYSAETGLVDIHTKIVNFNEPYRLHNAMYLQDNGLALAYTKFYLADSAPWGKYYLLEPIRD